MAMAMAESDMVCSGQVGRVPGSRSARCAAGWLSIHRPNRIIAQLAHVPIGVGQCQTDHGDILPDAFHLLGPPEREGIVVPVGEENAVRRGGVQQIVREVGGQPGIGAVPPRCGATS